MIELLGLSVNQLLQKMDAKMSKMQDKLTELDIKVTDMHSKQQGTDPKSQAQGAEPAVEDGEGLDRKRLKERFKKALLLDSGPLANISIAPSAWMEFIFGIGAPDQRLGKEGSRFLACSADPSCARYSRVRTDEACRGRLIHPSSLFVQGPRRSPAASLGNECLHSHFFARTLTWHVHIALRFRCDGPSSHPMRPFVVTKEGGENSDFEARPCLPS